MKDPHENIFFYYRGPSKGKTDIDYQLENNVTKAFMNTLKSLSENSRRDLLGLLGIPYGNKASFSFQYYGSGSIPDASIRYENGHILIESKVDAEFNEVQYKKHSKAFEDVSSKTLVAITKNEDDGSSVEKILMPGIYTKHILWSSVGKSTKSVLSRTSNGTVDNFMLKSFLEYLEVIGLTEFMGFTEMDFNAFMYVDREDSKQRKDYVKNKFVKFSNLLFSNIKLSLKNVFGFSKPGLHEVGNIYKDSSGIWAGIFDKQYGEKPSPTLHFSIYITADHLGFDLWAETKIPTQHIKKQILGNMQGFRKILRKLDGYELCLDHRVMKKYSAKDGKIKSLRSKDTKKTKNILKIQTGKFIEIADIDYYIQKIDTLDLFQFYITKVYPRDIVISQGDKILDIMVNDMSRLSDAYKFLNNGYMEK